MRDTKTPARRSASAIPGTSRFICVVGAPRCGTTSLAGFLQEHPAVCFSAVKEPHFFSQNDLTGLPSEELRRVVETQYLARFFPHRPEQALLAEGSVSYLYAAEQMEAIVRLWPDARFVIAVRDPLEMLPSLHQRLLYVGDETVTDFERAWRMIPERAQGRRIPRTCIEPRLLRYDEIGRLGAYVERFFRAVGRERCFVSVYDDLAADPAGHYRRLTEFLDLPGHERADFASRRESLGYKIGWLQRLLKRPPIATRKLLAGEKYRTRVKPLNGQNADSALVRAIFAGRKKLLNWNKAPPPPVRMSAALRREIRETLAADVALLSRLIDRDLSHWLDGAPLADAPLVATAPERTADRAPAPVNRVRGRRLAGSRPAA